ncbi:MAG: SurA N-terminal domain-containing protein, partial [Thermodesulfobacteriota bacterium]|nr:SurA N-terminal domain-containing protein [Thermodesulfobacteriota bacterium]
MNDIKSDMTNHRFPSILSIFPAIILFILCTSPLHAAELVDRVVAVVNDGIITMSEVNDAGNEYFRKITAQAPPAQLADALSRAREEVLDNLIDKELIVQEAQKQNVSVSDEELQRAAEQMLIKNNLTRDMLDAQLGQMGMNYDTY